MNSIDSDFFSEYKRFEKLCGDIYSCQNGVTQYINEMNDCTAPVRYKISSWNEDLRLLKHLRGLRNTLAHEEADSICTEKDIEDLKIFYNRILSQSDPLAELHRLDKNADNKFENNIVQTVYFSNETNDKPGKKKRHFVRWIILILLVIVTVVLFLLNYDKLIDVFY